MDQQVPNLSPIPPPFPASRTQVPSLLLDATEGSCRLLGQVAVQLLVG